MTQNRFATHRPATIHDVTPTSLHDVYKPQTPEERAGLARAYAVREMNRGFRRSVGKVLHRLDVMEARQAARRRFGRR